MGKGEHGEEKCGGIWVQAKNNLHLNFSQLLCADFKNVSVLVKFFFTLSVITHTSAPVRGHSTTTVLHQPKTCSTGAADNVSCSRAPQQ